MKKIYISGKITGDPYYEVKFKSAEYTLSKFGYAVVNPCLVVPANCTDWAEAMKLVVREMLLCDGVALLPDWKKSKGAKIEAKLAGEVGIPVKPVKEWVGNTVLTASSQSKETEKKK